jgi:radical SAM-linked protein
MVDLPQAKYRLRLVFAKKAQVKFISHLDLALAWERALRRARMPLAYSQGFNPRPKIQLASGLPVGTISRAEVMDIIVTRPVDPAEAFEQINQALPAGLQLLSIEEVPLKAPTLQNLLRQAEYQVTVETGLPAEELVERIKKLLAAGEIRLTRQRKQQKEEIDLRGWVYDLQLVRVEDGQAVFRMLLAAGQHGNLRPQLVLEALGLGESWAETERTRLLFETPDETVQGE